MSYQERNKAVSLSITVLILAYYVLRWTGMVRNETLTDTRLFNLWATIIVATIVGTIVATIATTIVSAIVHAIQTQSKEEPAFIEDERDKLIELKGTRNAYIASSVGVLGCMLSFVFGGSALLMFGLLIVSGLVAGIVGDVSRLIYYRRGV